MVDPGQQRSQLLPDSEAIHALIAGCGDIGLSLAQRLIKRGYRVSGLRRNWSKQTIGGLMRVSADLTREESLTNLPTAIDQLIYCPTPDARNEAAYHSIYVDGLRRLLAAIDTSQLQRLVFVSSTAVYGQTDGGWVDEASCVEPVGFNGRVLLAAEKVVRESGIPGTIIRLAGVYGPGRGQLVARIRAGANCKKDYWTNRIHRDDAAGAIAHLLQLPNPAACYIGVDDRPELQCTVMKWLAGQLGLSAPTMVDNLPSHNKRCRNTRLKDTGYRFRFTDYRHGYQALLVGND